MAACTTYHYSSELIIGRSCNHVDCLLTIARKLKE